MTDRDTVRNIFNLITKINLRNWCFLLVLLKECSFVCFSLYSKAHNGMRNFKIGGPDVVIFCQDITIGP